MIEYNKSGGLVLSGEDAEAFIRQLENPDPEATRKARASYKRAMERFSNMKVKNENS